MGALLLPFTTAQRERLFNNRPANVGKGLALVGAATSAGARRAGVAAMEEQGKGWVRSALSTVLLAGRTRFAGWGFVAYFASNVGWLVFSWDRALWALFFQQALFTACSLYGVWNWLVRPLVVRHLIGGAR